MERTGYIEIKVEGAKGNFELTPDNYDIRDIISILTQAENLLFPNNKKERPTISYDIQEGSVKHIIKTSLQVIIGFNAILLSIQQNNYSIDFLETPTAKAFEFFQETAKKQGVEFQISTSVDNSSKISVDKNTQFIRSEEAWADAEFYFYGYIIDAGGKTFPNIHLDTKEYGVLKIEVDRKILREYETNPLYKRYGVRAVGKQNLNTGEFDKSTLRLLEIIDYNPSYNEDYIKGLINKARKSWEGIGDADEWLSQLR
jgi:hypothetical protein